MTGESFEQGTLDRVATEEAAMAKSSRGWQAQWLAKRAEEQARVDTARQAAAELVPIFLARGLRPDTPMQVSVRQREVKTKRFLGSVTVNQVAEPVTKQFWQLTRQKLARTETVKPSAYAVMHDPGASSHERPVAYYDAGVALDKKGRLWEYRTPEIPISDPRVRVNPRPEDPALPIIVHKATDEILGIGEQSYNIAHILETMYRTHILGHPAR